MKITRFSLLATLLLAGVSLSWADMPMSAGQCHSVDMYGIYKVCGAPPSDRQHEDHAPAIVQPVYVTAPQPVMVPAPVPGLAVSPPATADNDADHRDLSTIDARLHALHLRLVGAQNNNKIASSFFDEETRYLGVIEDHEKSASDANGGYLTVEQETSLLQQLQDVENEINQTIANNG